MSDDTRMVRAQELRPGDLVLVGHDLFEAVERRYTRDGHAWVTTDGHMFPYCIRATQKMLVRETAR